jgi:hypothetical protein
LSTIINLHDFRNARFLNIKTSFTVSKIKGKKWLLFYLENLILQE